MIAHGIPTASLLALATLTLTACGASGGASAPPAPEPSSQALAASTHATTSPANAPSSATTTARPPAASTTAPARLSSTAARAQFNQALSTFAACLRTNGVNVPSTSGSQALTLRGVNTKSPAYRGALAKCQPVLTAAFSSLSRSHPATSAARSSTPAVSPSSAAGAPRPPLKVPASVTATMTRFTACMRSNGVAGFPEPTGASFNLTGTSVNASAPQYKAAQTHCNSILQALDPRG